VKIDWKKEIKLPRLSLKRPKALSAGPSIKLPRAVTDLYADLRDRHLLPLVAVLIAAIVAAPILLNDKSETKQPPATPIAGVSTAGGSTSSFAVVPAARRLRSPGKRLAHRQALDPFRVEARKSHKPKGSGAVDSTGGTGSNGTVESGGAEAEAPVVASSAAAESTATEIATAPTEPPANTEVTITESANGEKEMRITEAPSSTPPSGTAAEPSHESGAAEGSPAGTAASTPPSNGGNGTEGEVVAYTVDMKSGVLPAELTEQADVAPMTKLPSDKNPLVVFVGLSQDGKRALFLMTSKVTAYYGSVHCVVDQQACQMVELKPGNAVIFAYGLGEEEARYKVVLQKIEPATGTTAAGATSARKTTREGPAPRADALSAARRFSK
jgi:hypothetical protein